MGSLLESAICARCGGPLDGAATCGAGGQTSPRLASIRVLLADASTHIDRWRQQLGLVLQQASETIRALAVQASTPDPPATTRPRLQALARSIAEQADDVRQLVGPA